MADSCSFLSVRRPFPTFWSAKASRCSTQHAQDIQLVSLLQTADACKPAVNERVREVVQIRYPMPTNRGVSAHAQTIDTRPFFPLPQIGLGTRLYLTMRGRSLVGTQTYYSYIHKIHVQPTVTAMYTLASTH